MPTFQAPILNKLPSATVTGVGEKEIERRRLALQHALASCLSVDEMAHTVRLCEQEFARKTSVSVSELCHRLFETMPQIQLDKEARLRLLRAMRQPAKAPLVDTVMPAPQPPEPMELLVPLPLPAPEDATSPELFMLRYANLGKAIIG
jgi:hypothetical protein